MSELSGTSFSSWDIWIPWTAIPLTFSSSVMIPMESLIRNCPSGNMVNVRMKGERVFGEAVKKGRGKAWSMTMMGFEELGQTGIPLELFS